MTPADSMHPADSLHPADLRVNLAVPGRVRAAFEATLGDVIAVVGPNGAGKSSLVAALAGLTPATGEATTAQGNLLDLDTQQRRVGLAAQSGWLFPHLSALDNVGYGLRARGASRAEARTTAAKWLARFGIEQLADRRPSQLSGGQAQRVVLARALAASPALLLLDEPTAGLDLAAATALRIELAQHLAAFNGITVLVTHTALDALTLATRILVLQDGVIVQNGTPAEVSARPATPHVARLLGLNVVPDEADGVLTFAPSAVAVSLEPPSGSPRLRWQGTVAELTGWGSAVRVTLTTPVGQMLADVTEQSVHELALLPGREVWLAVKQTAVQE